MIPFFFSSTLFEIVWIRLLLIHFQWSDSGWLIHLGSFTRKGQTWSGFGVISEWVRTLQRYEVFYSEFHQPKITDTIFADADPNSHDADNVATDENNTPRPSLTQQEERFEWDPWKYLDMYNYSLPIYRIEIIPEEENEPEAKEESPSKYKVWTECHHVILPPVFISSFSIADMAKLQQNCNSTWCVGIFHRDPYNHRWGKPSCNTDVSTWE